MKKLFITENAITDMRNKGIINSKEVGNYLYNTYGYSTNLQDCKLVPITPRSYMAAKKNPNPIIGIANGRIWGGYNEKDLEGPMVYGLFGKDMFKSFHNYYDKIRDNFAKCAEFYVIVPIDEDSYKSANEIRRDREQMYDVSIRDNGSVDFYGYERGKNKGRSFTQADVDSYDPDVNRRRYKAILTKNHLNKYVKEYDMLCDKFNEFKDRFHNLDIRNVGYGFNSILKSFGDFVDAVRWLNSDIDNINSSNSYWKPVESDLQRRLEDAKKKADSLDRALTSRDV